jgi:hypothetical protein
MLPGDVLICPPVVRAQGEKCSVGSVAYDKPSQVEHGEAAFATAMRRSIDSDSERLAADIVCGGVKADLDGMYGFGGRKADIVGKSSSARRSIRCLSSRPKAGRTGRNDRWTRLFLLIHAWPLLRHEMTERRGDGLGGVVLPALGLSVPPSLVVTADNVIE